MLSPHELVGIGLALCEALAHEWSTRRRIGASRRLNNPVANQTVAARSTPTPSSSGRLRFKFHTPRAGLSLDVQWSRRGRPS